MEREHVSRGLSGFLLGAGALWLALAGTSHLGTYLPLALRTAPALVALGLVNAVLIVAVVTWRLRVVLAPSASLTETAGLALIAAIGEIIRFAGLPMLGPLVVAGLLFSRGHRPLRLVVALAPIALLDLPLRDGIAATLAAAPVILGVALAGIPAWWMSRGPAPRPSLLSAFWNAIRSTWRPRAVVGVLAASVLLLVILASSTPIVAYLTGDALAAPAIGTRTVREAVDLPDPIGYSPQITNSPVGLAVMVERGVLLLGVLAGGLVALRLGRLPDRERLRGASEPVLLAGMLVSLVPLRLQIMQRVEDLPFYIWDGPSHLSAVDLLSLGELPAGASLYHALAGVALVIAEGPGIIALGVFGAAAAALALHALLRRIGAGAWAAVLIAGAAGNIPLIAYASIGLAPDIYVLTFSAVGLLAVVARLQDGWRIGSGVRTVGAVVAAVLTKANGIALAVPAALAVAVDRRHRIPRAAILALVAGAGVLAIIVWPYARSAGSVLIGRLSGAAGIAPWDPAGTSAWRWFATQLMISPYADIAIARCSLPALTVSHPALAALAAIAFVLPALYWGLRLSRGRDGLARLAWPAGGAFAVLGVMFATDCSGRALLVAALLVALALALLGACVASFRGPLTHRLLVGVLVTTVAIQVIGYLGSRYAHPRHSFPAVAACAGLAWIGWVWARPRLDAVMAKGPTAR